MKRKINNNILGENLENKIFWNFCKQKYFWRSRIIAPPPLPLRENKECFVYEGGTIIWKIRKLKFFIFLKLSIKKKQIFFNVFTFYTKTKNGRQKNFVKFGIDEILKLKRIFQS
jgi:hypothetical protein